MDANVIAHKMREAGEDWADKDAAASLLEEIKHSVLAQVMTEAPPDCGSVAAKEAWARAHETYTEHIKSMTEARRQANRAKVKWESIRSWVDLLRSQEASRRAEMGMK